MLSFSASGDAKLTADDWRPQAAEIAAHTKAMLCTGQVTREAALEGLRKIKDALRLDYQMSEADLRPISKLMAELEASNDASDPQT
jgi:hypothetical protein